MVFISKKFSLLFLLSLFCQHAYGEQIATGNERYEYPEKGLTIIPPAGFLVHENNSGFFLNFSEPPVAQKQKKFTYRRNIQVYWNNDYRYIDETSAAEFKEIIPQKFEKYGGITNYQMSPPSIVDLGKRKGILFYNTYNIDAAEMMHVMMIISSKTSHYVVTYTDLKENYDKNENNEEYNSVWWNCFTSIGLDSESPIRYQNVIYGSIGLGILLLIGMFIFMFRSSISSKSYHSFADESVDQQEMVEMVDDDSDSEGAAIIEDDNDTDDYDTDDYDTDNEDDSDNADDADNDDTIIVKK